MGQEALDDLARAEQAAAAVPVIGPGLRVTLANAESSADQDPVGETTEEAAGGRVRDGDLQLVVNALWAAGAEAVSINGQRLGPTSAIRFAGEAVLVDFRPVTNPYEISAIGDPDTLSSRFLAIPEVSALASVAVTFDMRFDFAQEDHLSLPAASAPELRVARAESQQKSAPASETPGLSVIPIIGLAAGVLLGLFLDPTVPLALQPYLPIAVVAALDAVFGGLRARLDGIFDARVFVISFVSNVVVAALIVFLGDQLGVGAQLSTAVVVVLGIRIFGNAAAIRRHVFRA